MNRRKFMIGAAGAGALLLGAGAWVSTRDIEKAREPWRFAAGDFDDPRMYALAHAILAPNPHNRQPWLIELVGKDSLRLLPDLSRMLPETDPPNRQITIGFGAFLELLRQAASVSGHELAIDAFPKGARQDELDSRPIAMVSFRQTGIEADPLASTILDRRTTRAAFEEGRAVSEDALKEMNAAIGGGDRFRWTSDPDRVAALTAINREGWNAEVDNAATHRESTALTRIGAAEVNADPDGISLHGPLIETISATGTFSRERLNEKGSFAEGQVRQFYLDVLEATATYGWLVSADNSREDQLRSGEHWVRLNQAATRAGVAFHPVSQVLQEFPAMAESLTGVHRLLGVESPARIQGIFRLGYADFPEASPRWPLESRILDA